MYINKKSCVIYQTVLFRPPKPPPIAEFAAKFLSAENPPKKIRLAKYAAKFCLPKIRHRNTDIRLIFGYTINVRTSPLNSSDGL